MPDTENDDLGLEEGEDGDEGDEGGEPEKPKAPDATGNEGKRLSDLQSRADAAEARANKLEKLLAGRGESGDKGGNDPDTAALMTELREAGLDAVYGEFSELKDYGIDRTLIEGTTRAEMRDSATSLVGLIKSLETKVRNKTLRDHGIKAEPAGSARTAPKDYGSMGDEEFEKELARVKSGGNPVW